MRITLLSLYAVLCVLHTSIAWSVSLHGGGYNDGIHLAVSPICGDLAGNVTDVNAGLNLRDYKTIVSFGVRFYARVFV